jgi:transposase
LAAPQKPPNLLEKKGEKERLEEALRMNEPLYTACYLNENLKEVWNQSFKKHAETVLDEWIPKASSSGIPMLKTMAKTLSAYRSGILASYDFPISTGPLKGTNTRSRR